MAGTPLVYLPNCNQDIKCAMGSSTPLESNKNSKHFKCAMGFLTPFQLNKYNKHFNTGLDLLLITFPTLLDFSKDAFTFSPRRLFLVLMIKMLNFQIHLQKQFHHTLKLLKIPIRASIQRITMMNPDQNTPRQAKSMKQ